MEGIDLNNPFERIVMGVMSFGLVEVGVQIENKRFRNQARDYVNKISILRADLINEKLNEKAEETARIEKEALRKTEFVQQMTEVKEKHLKPKLLDLIQREKEGKATSIPNCIMISGSNPEVSSELIEWTGKNTNCKFVSIKHTEGLLKILKSAENNYQQTGDRTLIHVDRFDQLLDHSITPNHIIESLKSIMSSSSEDYHTTIIFSTTDPSKLDKIALEPHRTVTIDANFKTPSQMNVDDATTRLAN